MGKIDRRISELQKSTNKILRFMENITGYEGLEPLSEYTRGKDLIRLNELSKDFMLKQLEVHLLLKDKLPVTVDRSFTHNGVPVIYSYEKVRDGLFCMYDVTHGNSPEKQFGLSRMDVFLNGIKKIQPTVVFLELSVDTNRAISMYQSGKISRNDVDMAIIGDSQPSGLDRYSEMLDYSKRNGIRVVCADMPSPKNSDPLLPEDFDDRYLGSGDVYTKIQNTRSIQDYIREEQMLNVIEHESKETDTGLLIIGNAHRMTFPKLARKN